MTADPASGGPAAGEGSWKDLKKIPRTGNLQVPKRDNDRRLKKLNI